MTEGDIAYYRQKAETARRNALGASDPRTAMTYREEAALYDHLVKTGESQIRLNKTPGERPKLSIRVPS